MGTRKINDRLDQMYGTMALTTALVILIYLKVRRMERATRPADSERSAE